MNGRRVAALGAGAVLALSLSVQSAGSASATTRATGEPSTQVAGTASARAAAHAALAAARSGLGRRLPIRAANLGDSFAAGEGGVETGPYRRGTDTATNTCHRSPTSPARLLAATGILRITADAACSGAVTANVDLLPKNGEPPQVSRLNAGHRLVYVMAGGNDVGFGVLLGCYLVTACDQTDLPAQGVRRVAELGPRLDAMYDAIRSRAPRARVVVGLYPDLFPAAGSPGPACPYLNSGELVLARRIQTALNATIRDRALAHGFRVADPNRYFRSHDACALDTFFYLPATVPPSATLHPNLPGRVAIAAAYAVASI